MFVCMMCASGCAWWASGVDMERGPRVPQPHGAAQTHPTPCAGRLRPTRGEEGAAPDTHAPCRRVVPLTSGPAPGPKRPACPVMCLGAGAHHGGRSWGGGGSAQGHGLRGHVQGREGSKGPRGRGGSGQDLSGKSTRSQTPPAHLDDVAIETGNRLDSLTHTTQRCAPSGAPASPGSGLREWVWTAGGPSGLGDASGWEGRGCGGTRSDQSPWTGLA